MKFIINGKKYNTDTSTEIIEYQKKVFIKGRNMFGETAEISKNQRAKLYRTNKGNWYSLIYGEDGEMTAVEENENLAKKILLKENAIDAYEKYFNKLEEA